MGGDFDRGSSSAMGFSIEQDGLEAHGRWWGHYVPRSERITRVDGNYRENCEGENMPAVRSRMEQKVGQDASTRSYPRAEGFRNLYELQYSLDGPHDRPATACENIGDVRDLMLHRFPRRTYCQIIPPFIYCMTFRARKGNEIASFMSGYIIEVV
jgi:hypothetical protein